MSEVPCRHHRLAELVHGSVTTIWPRSKDRGATAGRRSFQDGMRQGHGVAP